MDAASHAEVDPMRGVSENIIMGQLPRMGTGIITIYNFIKYQINHKIFRRLLRSSFGRGEMQSWNRNTTSDRSGYFIFWYVLRFGRYTKYESSHDTMESRWNAVRSRKRLVSVARISRKRCYTRRCRILSVCLVGCFGNVAELCLASTQSRYVTV